jgi:hypothetical protein
MKMSLRNLWIASAVLASVTFLFASKLDSRGREWLDEHKDPPTINVSGDWDSDWGLIHLDQTANSRDVTGRVTKYELVGAVSGKTLYLLFATSHGGIDYCAVLDAAGDTSLVGNYHYQVTRLRLGHGLCQEKGYAMNLRKR